MLSEIPYQKHQFDTEDEQTIAGTTHRTMSKVEINKYEKESELEITG